MPIVFPPANIGFLKCRMHSAMVQRWPWVMVLTRKDRDFLTRQSGLKLFIQPFSISVIPLQENPIWVLDETLRTVKIYSSAIKGFHPSTTFQVVMMTFLLTALLPKKIQL